VVDYNNRNLKFYRNNTLYTNNNIAETMLFPNVLSAKYFGTYSSNDFLKGYLDNIRIYNRVLTANEIAEIYNKTKGKYQ
jgi:hypothetical protein